jgi:hypothetical protein
MDPYDAMDPYRGKTPTNENLDHVEMATMSDKPLGPGWWQTSDGTWHPPELHPSMKGKAPSPAQEPDPSSLAPTTFAPVPTADAVQAAPVAPMPSMEPVAQVAPVPSVAPDLPVTQMAPVVDMPADAPVATAEMPGFRPTSPRPVPSLADVQSHPSWSGESDLRPGAGPMFPDMFQQAVADSQVVSAVTMNFADNEYLASLDVQPPSGSIDASDLLVSSSFRMPAEVGAFIGASAKKRRWHH